MPPEHILLHFGDGTCLDMIFEYKWIYFNLEKKFHTRHSFHIRKQEASDVLKLKIQFSDGSNLVPYKSTLKETKTRQKDGTLFERCLEQIALL